MKKLETKSCEEIMSTAYKSLAYCVDGLLTQLQIAFKALAGAGNLYKNPDTGYEHRLKDYYWLNNDHLENIDGDYREIERIETYKIISYGNTYVKVKPSECDNIDFKRI